jgi:hypothetical protein
VLVHCSPPRRARLGSWFRALLASYSLDGLLYGHFGDGCVHVRIDFPMDAAADADLLRRFLTDAAHLVATHGGSLSGEHGDGRARSELLPVMYSEHAVRAFANSKQLLDPADLLNPGVLVRPRSLDANLRRPGAAALPRLGGYAFGADAGDFTAAVHRCVGVGKCRAEAHPEQRAQRRVGEVLSAHAAGPDLLVTAPGWRTRRRRRTRLAGRRGPGSAGPGCSPTPRWRPVR